MDSFWGWSQWFLKVSLSENELVFLSWNCYQYNHQGVHQLPNFITSVLRFPPLLCLLHTIYHKAQLLIFSSTISVISICWFEKYVLSDRSNATNEDSGRELVLGSAYLHSYYPGPSLWWIQGGHQSLDSSLIERFYIPYESLSLWRYRLWALYRD